MGSVASPPNSIQSMGSNRDEEAEGKMSKTDKYRGGSRRAESSGYSTGWRGHD